MPTPDTRTPEHIAHDEARDAARAAHEAEAEAARLEHEASAADVASSHGREAARVRAEHEAEVRAAGGTVEAPAATPVDNRPFVVRHRKKLEVGAGIGATLFAGAAAGFKEVRSWFNLDWLKQIGRVLRADKTSWEELSGQKYNEEVAKKEAAAAKKEKK